MVGYSVSPAVPAFDQFKELSQDEVRGIIINTSNNCCSLNPLPTENLKTCIVVLISPITAIVNKLLSCGNLNHVGNVLLSFLY